MRRNGGDAPIPAIRASESESDTADRCRTIGPVHPRCSEHLGLAFSPDIAGSLTAFAMLFPLRRRPPLLAASKESAVPSAIVFHFSGSLVFSLTFQVGTPASINASSNRFPASIKTAGSVQSPAGSGFHSVSATRPSRGGTNCDTMRQSSSAVIWPTNSPKSSPSRKFR
jgi:hypothetical protein